MDLTKLQPCDVIFFSGKGFVSRGIRFFTNSEWSHVALYVGGGEGYVIEATAAGVEKNKLAPLIKHAAKWEVRRFDNLTVEEAELMKAKAYSLIYENYDFLQVLSLGVYYAFRKIGLTWSALVANTNGKMICSELVAVCALCINRKFKSKTKLVTPKTLYDSCHLHKVYELENE